MTRWTEADIQSYEARVVGHQGEVNRHPTRIKAKVSVRYTAKREWLDDICFGSQAELQRYKDLKLMEAGGAISGLKVHPRYDLYACGVMLGYVELDFEYLDSATSKMVYEDVKDPKKNSATRTAISKWKMKHLEAEHGIRVSIVT